MNSESLNAHFKRIMLAVIVVFSCIMQFANPFLPKFFSFSVLFVLPVTVCISMFQGEIISVGCALIAGIFWDSVSAQSYCFNTLFLCIFAFLISYAVQKRLRNFLATALILNLGATLIYIVLHWLIFVLIKGTQGAVPVLFTYYIPSFIVTAVISVPIYYFIKAVHKKFSEM